MKLRQLTAAYWLSAVLVGCGEAQVGSGTPQDADPMAITATIGGQAGAEASDSAQAAYALPGQSSALRTINVNLANGRPWITDPASFPPGFSPRDGYWRADTSNETPHDYVEFAFELPQAVTTFAARVIWQASAASVANTLQVVRWERDWTATDVLHAEPAEMQEVGDMLTQTRFARHEVTQDVLNIEHTVDNAINRYAVLVDLRPGPVNRIWALRIDYLDP